MATLNQVSLIGYLGADPKISITKAGRKVASICVATTDQAYTKAGGVQVPERTEWHNVTLWGKQAEIAEKYLRKGSSIFVQGKLRTRSYEDNAGIRHFSTEVEADIMQMLDRPRQQ